MIIYLSPAKVLNLNGRKYHTLKIIEPKKTQKLYEISKSFSIPQLQFELNLSETLAQKVHRYYQDISTTYHPLELFQGEAFKSFDYQSLSKQEQKIADQTIFIGDAYYGLIRGIDRIYPYRLDFTRLFNEINLYLYWKSSLKPYFNQPLVDLSSKEYQQLLPDRYHLSQKRVDLFKGTSFQRKTFRGFYARTIIQKKISTLNALESMDIKGYTLVSNTEYELLYQID